MPDISIEITGGTIGQMNVKSLVNNLNACIVALNTGGAQDTAQAIQGLAEALGNAAELDDDTRRQALESLEDLAEQAQLQPGERKLGRIKAALAFIAQVGATASSAALAVQQWAEVLRSVLLPNIH